MRSLTVLLFPLLAACATQPVVSRDFLPSPVAYEAGRFTAKLDANSVFGQENQSGGLEFSIQKTAFHAPEPDRVAARRVERHIIYNGSLALQVAEVREAGARVAGIVRELDGWIQDSGNDHVTIRVPAPRFEEAMTKLAALGQLVDRRVRASDVTDEFVDLKLRLENAEKLRARYAALLEKAKTVEETLAVEKELARVTGEIERLKGKIARMGDRIAHSTIEVRFQRVLPANTAGVRFPFGWLRGLGVEMLLQF